jgi:hypothetical protein
VRSSLDGTPTGSPRLPLSTRSSTKLASTRLGRDSTNATTNELPLAERLALENIQLKEYWNDPKFTSSFDDDLEPPAELTSVAEPTAFDLHEFQAESEQIRVVVSRIPQEMVKQPTEKAQLDLFNFNNNILDVMKRREVDVIWTENLARERVTSLEAEARKRLENEREKMVDDTLEK